MRDLLNRVLVALLILLLPLPGLGADPEVFRMAFYLPGFRDANPADVRLSLQIWAEEVGSGEGIRARAVIYEDLKALHQDAHDAKMEVVIASGMELAETFHPHDFANGFTSLRYNTPEGLALITARQADIQRFTDLKGKHLARLSNDRLSDVYLAVQCAREAKVPCEQLFDSSEEKKDVQSIHKVFFGKADAALVRLSTLRAAQELNPQINQRIKVLQEWKTPALSFGLFLQHTTPTYRERVSRIAMNVTKTPRGRQILEMFKADYMEKVDTSALQPFWQLHREYLAQNRPAAARK